MQGTDFHRRGLSGFGKPCPVTSIRERVSRRNSSRAASRTDSFEQSFLNTFRMGILPGVRADKFPFLRPRSR